MQAVLQLWAEANVWHTISRIFIWQYVEQVLMKVLKL